MNFRLRCDKISLILKGAEDEIRKNLHPDVVYIKDICETALSEMEGSSSSAAVEELEKISSGSLSGNELLFAVNNLRYLFLSEIGRDPAEWDLATYSDKKNPEERKILDINVYLDNIRSPFNVGSVFRTAESFCFKKVFLSEFTPSPDQKRAKRSSMGTSDIVEWGRRNINNLPSPVFALELGGSHVQDFKFPEAGTVIIGSEELGVSPEAINKARNEGGIVTIPLYGCKSSINVGVAFGILAHSWTSFILSTNNK